MELPQAIQIFVVVSLDCQVLLFPFVDHLQQFYGIQRGRPWSSWTLISGIHNGLTCGREGHMGLYQRPWVIRERSEIMKSVSSISLSGMECDLTDESWKSLFFFFSKSKLCPASKLCWLSLVIFVSLNLLCQLCSHIFFSSEYLLKTWCRHCVDKVDENTKFAAFLPGGTGGLGVLHTVDTTHRIMTMLFFSLADD